MQDLVFKDIPAVRLKLDDIVVHKGGEWVVASNAQSTSMSIKGRACRALTLTSLHHDATDTVRLPSQQPVPKLVTRGRRVNWIPGPGDVLHFWDEDPERRAVAVRRPNGDWHDSATPRLTYTDRRMQHQVKYFRATVLRTDGKTAPLKATHLWSPGTVLATTDPAELYPSAWLRVADDLWRSTAGVEASDAMILHEWTRGTYVLLYSEGRPCEP